MKKKTTPDKKLQLLRSTVRDLDATALSNVAGGMMADEPPSKICETSVRCCNTKD